MNLDATCCEHAGSEFLLSDRSLAKDSAGSAERRPPTDGLQDKRREVRPVGSGKMAGTSRDVRPAPQPAKFDKALRERCWAHLARSATHFYSALSFGATMFGPEHLAGRCRTIRHPSRLALCAPGAPASTLIGAGLARLFDGQALKAFCERQRSRGGKKSGASREFGRFCGWAPACHTGAMGRREKSFSADAALSGSTPSDLYDYAKPAVRRLGRPVRTVDSDWTVTDDWPDEVPVSQAEIGVFEAWFGDLFDELFSARH